MTDHGDLRPAIEHVLESGEELHAGARATDAVIAVTDRRVIVAAGNHLTLDIEFAGLRRIQFDIEKRRPATLVLVPELSGHDPQVLAIPAGELERAAAALTIVGRRLAALD